MAAFPSVLLSLTPPAHYSSSFSNRTSSGTPIVRDDRMHADHVPLSSQRTIISTTKLITSGVAVGPELSILDESTLAAMSMCIRFGWTRCSSYLTNSIITQSSVTYEYNYSQYSYYSICTPEYLYSINFLLSKLSSRLTAKLHLLQSSLATHSNLLPSKRKKV